VITVGYAVIGVKLQTAGLVTDFGKVELQSRYVFNYVIVAEVGNQSLCLLLMRIEAEVQASYMSDVGGQIVICQAEFYR